MKKYTAHTLKKIIRPVLVGSLVSFSVIAHASGFQLTEQNAVNMGDFGAGGAAIAEDASTAYFNPAGLIRIPNQQLVVSGVDVITSLNFSGTNTWSNPFLPSSPPFTNSITQAGSAQGGAENFIPALHYAAPLSDQWEFGFSVASPFGLTTNYGSDSILNYAATQTKLTVIDISPDLAYAINKKLSLGAGVDFERASADLDSVGASTLIFAPGPTPVPLSSTNTLSQNSGTGWGYGFHAGVLYQFTPATRVGLAYRSQVHFNLQGSSKFIGPLAGSGGILANNSLQAGLMLPPTTTLSAYHDINSAWAIDSSINYTQWDTFNQALNLQNVQIATPLPGGSFVPTLIGVSIPEYFHNAWRFAGGVQYTPIQDWIVRAGAGFDQSPVDSMFRNIRLPDGNRFGVSLGAHYQATKAVGVDAGWTHLFIQDTTVTIPAVTGPQTSTPIGTFTNRADLVGMQVTWNIT